MRKCGGKPVSIKTIIGNGRVKVAWTVDAAKAWQFVESHAPNCDNLLARIKWDLKDSESRRYSSGRSFPYAA